MSNLFIKQDITLHSGEKSDFKIECDALSGDDLDCLAYLISKSIKFKKVIGVPSGGIVIEKALNKYCISDDSLPILICDDVLTSGGSMIEMRDLLKNEYKDKIVGVVIFNRGVCPDWVMSVFDLNLSFSSEKEDDKFHSNFFGENISRIIKVLKK